MAADSLRLATLAADGRVDAAWPGGSGVLSAIRHLVAERARSVDHSDATAGANALSALLTIATWAAALRTAAALSAFILGRDAVTDGPIPTETHALMILVLAGAGGVLIYGGQRETRSVSLGTMFVLLASSFSPRMLSGFEGASAIGVAIPLLVRLPTEAMFASAAWWFAHSFPATPSGRPVQRMAMTMAWLSAVVGLVLVIANVGGLIFPDATWAEMTHHQRPGRSIFWMLLILLAAPSLPVILWKARSVSVAEQRRVRQFAWAMIIGLLPSTMLLLALVVTPSIRPHIQAHVAEYGLLFYGGLLTIPFSTAFAIRSAGVLPARLIVRRALLGSVARTTLILMVALPAAWLASEVNRSASVTLGEFLGRSGVVAALGLMAVGALLLFIRPQALRFIERRFDRQRGEIARSLALATGSIRTAIGAREVADAVRSCLADTFGTVKVTVMLGATDSQTLSSVGDPQPTQFARASALASLLETEPVPIVVAGPDASRCIRLLPAFERQALTAMGAEVVCPIPNTSGRLIGAVSLGPRANERTYSSADLESIATLCATAGIAVENRFLAPSNAQADQTAAVECIACGRVFEPHVVSCECDGQLKDARVPIVVSGRYRVKRRVGAGGMGVVYQGVDLTLDRQVALKALPAVTRAEAARLTKEAQVMASLSHPNIAHVYGLDIWRDTPVLALEFMGNGTLQLQLDIGTTFSEDEVCEIERSLRAALTFLHERGLLHRDVKPSNIGMRSDRGVALLDFGISVESDSIEAASLAGTFAYLTDEVFQGGVQTRETDMWALGQVLSQLKTRHAEGVRDE